MNTEAIKDPIQELLSKASSVSRFPFDFTPRLVRGGEATEIAGFKMVVKNDLTALESVIYETIENELSDASNEITKTTTALIVALQSEKELSGVDLDNIRQILFTPSEVTGFDSFLTKKQADGRTKYQIFIDNNQDKIAAWGSAVSEYTEKRRFLDTCRVTIAMQLRHNPNWTLQDTLDLTRAELAEVSAFINKEANGGVIPVAATEEANLEVSEGKGA